MTKRKRGRPRLTAAMLPIIRDHTADCLERMAAWSAGLDDVLRSGSDVSHLKPELQDALRRYLERSPEHLGEVVSASMRAEVAALRSDTAALWFVTEAMTLLARQAAPDLPEWSPSIARPARSGVVIWAGAMGMIAPLELLANDDAVTAPVVGIAWDFDDAGEFGFTPLVFSPRDRYVGPGGVSVAEAGRSAFRHDGSHVGFTADLWRMLGATWLLAQSPTVGRTWGMRYDRRDPDRPFARPTLPSSITVVALREVARRAEPGDPWDDGLTRQERGGPSYRHMVRGHWRQQPCGPGRKLRKPVFVAPFARGPGDLVTKPTVSVWRR